MVALLTSRIVIYEEPVPQIIAKRTSTRANLFHHDKTVQSLAWSLLHNPGINRGYFGYSGSHYEDHHKVIETIEANMTDPARYKRHPVFGVPPFGPAMSLTLSPATNHHAGRGGRQAWAPHD
jgi:hypothetical protein